MALIVDPVKIKVYGSWDVNAIPIFIADGIMLAQDYRTDEIVAIGSVAATLQVGGRAAVSRDVALRGAPSDTSIERAKLAPSTLVEVTGQAESSSGKDWTPVTVQETGESGWLPVEVLEAKDGPIRFTKMDPSEFGEFTRYS